MIVIYLFLAVCAAIFMLGFIASVLSHEERPEWVNLGGSLTLIVILLTKGLHLGRAPETVLLYSAFAFWVFCFFAEIDSALRARLRQVEAEKAVAK
jgi:hypothetical protein